jgi:hypothetical protein
MRRRNLRSLAWVSTLVLLPSIAFEIEAADTAEPFEVGASDVEFYLGAGGIGPGRYEKKLLGSVLLGFGLLDRLSAHLAASLEAYEHLADGIATLSTGLFGTPLDTDHLDLDFFIELSSAVHGSTEHQLYPAIELNFDVAPNMQRFGVYLRSGLPVYGRDIASDGGEATEYEVAFHNETTIGAYYTIAPRHQLLIEFNVAFRPKPAEDEASIEVGGAALGYNVVLHDAIEMINLIAFDIPQNAPSFSMGVMTGFIATLPSSAK